MDDEPEILSDNESEVDSVISDEPIKDTKKKAIKIRADDNEEDEDEDDDDDDYDLDDIDQDEFDEQEDKSDSGSVLEQNLDISHFPEMDLDEDEEEEEDEDYLKKFDDNMQQNIIQDHHPELHIHNYEEIESLCTVIMNDEGRVVDPLHKTIDFVTKYEKARVLGERAKQINAGATPFLDPDELDSAVIDGYLIALKEFELKKLPFIIQRPMPDGSCEYWRLKDLNIL